MSLFAIEDLTSQLVEALAILPEQERIEAINRVRRAIHQVSPMQKEPVDFVEWVLSEQVQSNDYNPNHVAPPEMRLLKLSILQDGYTQPIVGWLSGDVYTVVDGFHRSRVGKEYPEVRNRVKGYLPVVSIRPEREGEAERVAATIRHNRARGVHGVKPMTDIVASLIANGLDDTAVAKELGMDADEVLRYRQVKGLAASFKNREFSRSWE